MNIATLGAVIDPSGAISGGAQATQAAQSMASGMTSAAQRTTAANQQVTNSATTMGAAVQRSATTATTAANTAASAPGWARMRSIMTGIATGAGTAFDRVRSQAVAIAAGAGSAFDQLRNRAVASVSGIASAAGAAFGAIRNAAVATASAAGNAMGGLFTRIRAGLSSFGHADSLLDLGNAFGLMDGPAGRFLSRLDSLRRAITSIPGWVAPVLGVLGGLAAAFAGLYAAYNLTMASIEAAGPVQQMQQGLQAITGSAEQANAVVKALRENAVRTGADLQGSLSTTTKFIGMGFSPADAVKMNASIQDIAGTLGLSQARATELGDALVQVQSKGVVSMEELRQQIAEKGIPVFDELAKKMVVSTSQLIDMVEKGKVPSKELIDIFLNLEGGFAKFAGGAEKATATMPGAIGKLKAVWNDLLVTVGSPINDALTPVINQLSARLMGLADEGSTFGQSMAAGITAAAPAALSFLDTITGKIQGLFSMMSNQNGFWLTWAANIWATFVDGGLKALQVITAGFATIGEYLLAKFTDAVEFLAIATTPAFWSKMGSELQAIGLDFQGYLVTAAESFINTIRDAAPDWLKNGDKTRADFSSLSNAYHTAADAKRNMPQAELAAPDVANFNNGDTTISGIFAKKNAAMKETLKGTKEYWQGWIKDWNASKMESVNDKVTKGGVALSTKSGITNSQPFDKDAASKAAKEAQRLERQLDSLAKKYVEASQSPLEKYAATVREVEMLQSKSKLTAEQASAAMDKALKDLNNGTKQAALEAAGPVGKLMLQWGNLKNQVDTAGASMIQSLTGSIGNAVAGIVNGTTTAAQAWQTLSNSIIAESVRMVAQLAIQWALQEALGLITGTPATPTTYTAASAKTATVSAGVHHTGGMVGRASTTREVPLASFAGARRYQHGGTVGMSSGERPIIAESGEQVLTRDGAKDIRARLGDKAKTAAPVQSVQIMNIVDPSLIEAAIAKNPGIILNAIGANPGKVNRLLGNK